VDEEKFCIGGQPRVLYASALTAGAYTIVRSHDKRKHPIPVVWLTDIQDQLQQSSSLSLGRRDRAACGNEIHHIATTFWLKVDIGRRGVAHAMATSSIVCKETCPSSLKRVLRTRYHYALSILHSRSRCGTKPLPDHLPVSLAALDMVQPEPCGSL